jgi:predicted GNAT family N-acyltransferase
MPTSIRTFTYASPDYLLSLILRYKILRIPLGLTYSASDLEADQFDTHIGAFKGNILLGSLILSVVKEHSFKMRQVAVDDMLQGKGIGSTLVQFAEDFVQKNGGTSIYCHARKSAVAFYLKQGYTVVGEEFMEVNIPHYFMQKQFD